MGFWDLVVRRKNFWPWDDDPLTSFSLRSFLKGFQKEKKKKIYLNEKEYKISSSCFTFVRTIKFPYGALLLWFGLSQTSSIKYPP